MKRLFLVILVCVCTFNISAQQDKSALCWQHFYVGVLEKTGICAVADNPYVLLINPNECNSYKDIVRQNVQYFLKCHNINKHSLILVLPSDVRKAEVEQIIYQDIGLPQAASTLFLPQDVLSLVSKCQGERFTFSTLLFEQPASGVFFVLPVAKYMHPKEVVCGF